MYLVNRGNTIFNRDLTISFCVGFRKKNRVKWKENTNVEHQSPMEELLDKIDELDMMLNKVCIS